MRPNPLITRAFLARSARLWIVTRILASVVVALAGANPLHLTFAATMLIVAGSLALGVAEMYRRHERMLLENLAVSRLALAVLFTAPAIVGELGIFLAARLSG